jgi:hypothetical protein
MAPSNGPIKVKTNFKEEEQKKIEQPSILTPNEAMAKGNTPSNTATNAFNIVSNKPEASPITENPDEISRNINEQEENQAEPPEHEHEEMNENEQMMGQEEMDGNEDEMDGNGEEMEGDPGMEMDAEGMDPNEMDSNEMDADNQDPEMQGEADGAD